MFAQLCLTTAVWCKLINAPKSAVSSRWELAKEQAHWTTDQCWIIKFSKNLSLSANTPITLEQNQPESTANEKSECVRAEANYIRSAFVTFGLHTDPFGLIRRPIPNILKMFKAFGLIRTGNKFETDSYRIRSVFGLIRSKKYTVTADVIVAGYADSLPFEVNSYYVRNRGHEWARLWPNLHSDQFWSPEWLSLKHLLTWKTFCLKRLKNSI